MTYSAAIQWLYDLQLFGAKLGLENPRKLAELAGNPQERLRFIHVAGTNGKGSTCAMLDSVYRTAGLKVGLFTSPHLISFRERIRINGEMISEDGLIREVEGMQALLKEFPGPHHPTFFEVVVALALNWFARNECDLVIWETGLGGRLDATNIVVPLASVITNVSLDHQQWLGETVIEIAREKAGVIKPGVPVFTAAEDPDALAVIRNAAEAAGAPFTPTTGEPGAARQQPSTDVRTGQRTALQNPSLSGPHQRLNAQLAATVVAGLQDAIPVDATTLATGLRDARMDGRFQKIQSATGGTLILDGAHNEAGVDALLATLTEQFPTEAPTFVLGMLDDKAWAGMCVRLARAAARIILAPVASARSADANALAKACREANPEIEVTVSDTPASALEAAADQPLVVATGSLHYLGEVMEALGSDVATEIDERALNEYRAEGDN